MKLHFDKVGAGAPIVILHGFLGSADNWRTLALKMGELATVYTVDQRNHGKSPHTDEWSYELMAQDVVDLIQAEGIGPVTLIGHSMGGKTAMQLAAHHPELVEKLVVVDMATRANKPGHEQILKGLNAAGVHATNRRADIDAQLKPYIPEASIRQFLMKALTREGDAFKWRFNLKVLTEKYSHVLKGMEDNPEFDKPTLFIKGENSNYIRVQDWPEILALFPQADLSMISNAGHWVHAEAPNDFLNEVGKFLNLDFPKL